MLTPPCFPPKTREIFWTDDGDFTSIYNEIFINITLRWIMKYSNISLFLSIISYFDIQNMSIKPEAPKPPLTIKIILLGESSVGKTSLAARYTDNTFQHNQHLLTIGVDVKRINKPIMDRTVRLECKLHNNQYGIQPDKKNIALYHYNTSEEYKVYYSSMTSPMANLSLKYKIGYKKSNKIVSPINSPSRLSATKMICKNYAKSKKKQLLILPYPIK